MMMLYISAAAFFAIHFTISGSPLRGVIVGTIGAGPFRGLFSLATAGLIGWMIWSYVQVKGTGLLWVAPMWWQHAGSLLVLIAFLFAIIGLTTPSPTIVQGEKLLKKGGAGKGILRVTRHPFFWGLILWAVFHISVNGDLASLVFFGTLGLLAFVGTFGIDAKRKASAGAEWDIFARETSNIPFGAILTGRNRLALGEIGIIRPLIALALFGAVYYFHEFLFGVAAA